MRSSVPVFVRALTGMTAWKSYSFEYASMISSIRPFFTWSILLMTRITGALIFASGFFRSSSTARSCAVMTVPFPRDASTSQRMTSASCSELSAASSMYPPSFVRHRSRIPAPFAKEAGSTLPLPSEIPCAVLSSEPPRRMPGVSRKTICPRSSVKTVRICFLVVCGL